MTIGDDIDLDRRSFLKLGLAGSAALSVVGLGAALTGCGKSEQAVAQGFRFLRDADLVLLKALVPVALEGRPDAGIAVDGLRLLDELLLRAGTPAQAELRKLFDLLHLTPTRWLTTGVRKPWDQAGADEIRAFLARWRDSSVGLFNAGYRVLIKLATVPYYAQPAGYRSTGYPGPLAALHAAVNT
jgi:hypothetical protein